MDRVLVKTVSDGRKLEVFEHGLLLGGQLEGRELIAVAEHPNRAKILELAPDAIYMAGRVPLNKEESRLAFEALEKFELEQLQNPKMIEERFRRIAFKRQTAAGIE